LSGPRSLGEVVDMVMYKQNRGLEAKGTIGPQSTGPMMAPKKKPQYNLQSFAGTQPTPAPQPQKKAPPMPSAPMMAPRQMTQEQMNTLYNAYGGVKNFVNSPLGGGAAGFDELMAEYNRIAPRTTQRPAPRVGAIYSLPTNVTDVGPVSQEPTVTAGYRPPVESAAARVQNPFTPEMQALMEAKAIEQAEQQAAVTAQRLNAQLAGTGLMSGGPSGLSAGIARQVAMGTEANRLNALREIGLQVPQMRAEFDLRQAGMIDPYNINVSGEARALSRQPGELSLQEQQIRSAVIENDLKAIGLEQERDERVRQARIDDILNKAGLTDLERQAAERAFNESNPENPWNWRIWGALAGGIDALEKISRIPKNLSGLGSGGK